MQQAQLQDYRNLALSDCVMLPSWIMQKHSLLLGDPMFGTKWRLGSVQQCSVLRSSSVAIVGIKLAYMYVIARSLPMNFFSAF